MPDGEIVASDVGGTQLRVARMGMDGTVRDRSAVRTPENDPGMLGRMIRKALESADGPTDGAVIGMPGPVDYSKGEVLVLPNLPSWARQVSARDLAKELGIPVFLANDADLAALGEHRYSAGVGSTDMVYLTSSTGVGAGVIVGGRLLHGTRSMAEIGHTIIDRATGDTVESLGSGTTLTRLVGEDAASVTARAQAGEPDAVRDMATVAEAFAVGVLNMVHLFSPERVVIGGGMSQAGDLLLGPIRAMLAESDARFYSGRVDVVRAAGGDDVGLKGAVAYWNDTVRTQRAKAINGPVP
jgi:glucokinase